MSGLTVDDYKYFNDKFNEVYARIKTIDSDISKIKIESEKRLTEIETEHNIRKNTKTTNKRDLFQALSVAGAYIAIFVTLIYR